MSVDETKRDGKIIVRCGLDERDLMIVPMDCDRCRDRQAGPGQHRQPIAKRERRTEPEGMPRQLCDEHQGSEEPAEAHDFVLLTLRVSSVQE